MQLNDFTVAGFAGRDAELRQTQGGMAILEVPVAFTKKSKDGAKEATSWFRVKAFAKTAEIWAGIKKGDNVFAKGELQVAVYDKKDGTKGTSVDVLANYLSVMPRGETAQATVPPQRQAQPKPAPRGQSFEEEIPF